MTGLRLVPSEGPITPVEKWAVSDGEAAVIDAALSFLRWAHTAPDARHLPPEAYAVLDASEALSRLYDPAATSCPCGCQP